MEDTPWGGPDWQARGGRWRGVHSHVVPPNHIQPQHQLLHAALQPSHKSSIDRSFTAGDPMGGGGEGGGRGGTTAPAALERVQLPYLTSPTQLPPLAPHTVHAHTLELYTRSWHSSSIKFVAWSYPRSVPCSSRAAAAAGVGGWGGRRRGRGCQALGVVQVDQHDAARAGSSTHHYRPAIVGDHRHRRCEQGGGSGQGRGRRQ